MTDRLGRWWHAHPVARSLLVYAVLGALAQLDAGGPHGGQHAAIFGAIWAAIVAVGHVLGIVGGAIAASVEAAVVWLGTALGWLTRRVADILVSTGSMFAKVWEGLRLLWSSALRPFLVWLHGIYETLKRWLVRLFGPVFQFLNRVRAELLAAYRRFLRPILDLIDVVRGGLRLLGDLGLEWARQLDAKLGELESVITENFLRVLGEVNKIINVLDSVLTAERLFRSFPLLRSLHRDAGYLTRIWWNAQLARGRLPRPPQPPVIPDPLSGPAALARALGALYRGAPSDLDHDLNDAVNAWREVAGVTS